MGQASHKHTHLHDESATGLQIPAVLEAHALGVLLAVLVKEVAGRNVQCRGGKLDRELHVIDAAGEVQLRGGIGEVQGQVRYVYRDNVIAWWDGVQ